MSFIKLSIAAAAILSSAAFAAEAIIEAGKKEIKTKLEYVVLQVEAKCNPPRFEDDSFKPYFTDASYRLVAPYLDKGYSQVLLNKTCGGRATVEKPELSATQFEEVRVLLIDVNKANSSIRKQIGDVIDGF